jgi:hypothetical protein
MIFENMDRPPLICDLSSMRRREYKGTVTLFISNGRRNIRLKGRIQVGFVSGGLDSDASGRTLLIRSFSIFRLLAASTIISMF